MNPSTITLLCLSSFVPTRVVERPCSSVYSRLFLTLNEQFFMPYNYFLSIRFTDLPSSSTSNSFVILFRCLSTPNFPNVSCLFLCLLKLTGSLPTLSLSHPAFNIWKYRNTFATWFRYRRCGAAAVLPRANSFRLSISSVASWMAARVSSRYQFQICRCSAFFRGYDILSDRDSFMIDSPLNQCL